MKYFYPRVADLFVFYHFHDLVAGQMIRVFLSFILRVLFLLVSDGELQERVSLCVCGFFN